MCWVRVMPASETSPTQSRQTVYQSPLISTPFFLSGALLPLAISDQLSNLPLDRELSPSLRPPSSLLTHPYFPLFSAHSLQVVIGRWAAVWLLVSQLSGFWYRSCLASGGQLSDFWYHSCLAFCRTKT